MQVVILAAGRGTRLGALSENASKPLMPIMGEPLIVRTVRQLYENGFKSITVVTGHAPELLKQALAPYPAIRFIHNKRYMEDKNILSLLCGLRGYKGSSLVIEGDVAFSNAGASFLAAMARSRGSVWAACGPFCQGQLGGIMQADGRNNMVDLRYVPAFAEEWSGYLKNLGAIFIHKHMAKEYLALLEKAAQESLDQYFMDPWVMNLARLPAKVMDMGRHAAASFNTPEEYHAVCALVESGTCRPRKKEYPVEMVDLRSLKHIEDYSRPRVAWLTNKIMQEGVWTRPLCLDDQHALVMDGQHRMEAAHALGLKRVPAIRFAYDEVEVWTLRPRTHVVTTGDIVKRALKGAIYPYKTAKHKFPITINLCAIPLEALR